MVMLGAAILWFGWFGFNAGSALGANGLASSAFVATQLGAAGALIGWAILDRVRHGKVTAIGAVTGAVAGLVAITPAAGYVEPVSALVIGLIAGAVCFVAVEAKSRLGYDDSLDAVGVHLVGGLVGALLTGIFATLAVNPAGAEGSLAQVGKQAAACAIALAFSFVATLAILKVVDLLVGFRASEAAEADGLDVVEHGESAYTWGSRSMTLLEPSALSGDDLDALRERLVLEATAQVIENLRLESGARPPLTSPAGSRVRAAPRALVHQSATSSRPSPARVACPRTPSVAGSASARGTRVLGGRARARCLWWARGPRRRHGDD